MNCWIASYPRSGNTFLRILLQEVYGIYTWEGYGAESPQKVLTNKGSSNNNTHTFIKTHELPDKTQSPHTKLKTIYLIRDGRDAVVSMAYHRSQIVKPGSDYIFNLSTAILAPFGTSFGGWSKHVKQWSAHADIIIKFEDLIANPIQELKKLETIIDLPAADYSKIPTFKDLQTKQYSLGSGDSNLSAQQQQGRREKFFRSGKTNQWQTEIPKTLQSIFIHKHGDMLAKLGYSNTDAGKLIYIKLAKQYFFWFV
ncbi:hypothetical protein MNBD_GAMMA01-611, partial [hydrothermal vent metagenome]